LDRQEWEAAHQAFEEMYLHKDEIMGLLVKEIACELVFTSLVTNRMERARELYTDELKKYIEQFRKVMSSKERILCSVALLMDGNRLLAESIYDKVCQQRNEYLMQGEVASDIALMQAILSR
jgi:lipopolysaccharide biosynthesis regulator YciM